MEAATGKTFEFATGFIGELTHEAQTTRKISERIPAEIFDYKPHEKSMTISQPAVHVTEMTGGVKETCTKDGPALATMDYKPLRPQTIAELLECHDKTPCRSDCSLEGHFRRANERNSHLAKRLTSFNRVSENRHFARNGFQTHPASSRTTFGLSASERCSRTFDLRFEGR